jgi:uncharacterized delta-60 repeat protein
MATKKLSPDPRRRPLRSALAAVVAVAALLGGAGLALAAAGDLDTGFGDGGIAELPTHGQRTSNIVVARDGRITVAHLRHPGCGSRICRLSLALVRLRADGRLDGSFGRGGVVTSHLPSYRGRIHGSRPSDAWVRPVAAAASRGRLVVVGYRYLESPESGEVCGATVRTADYDGSCVTVDEDDYRPAIEAYHPNGSLDRSFIGGGFKVLGRWGERSWFVNVAVQPGGALILAVNAHGRHWLTRLRPNGTLDRSWGSAGRLKLPFSPGGIAVGPDGKVAVYGSSHKKAAIASYTRAGRPDRSFGRGGLLTRRFVGRKGRAESVVGLDFTTGGRMLAVTFASGNTADSGAVVRLSRSGELDRDYGEHGISPVGPVGCASLLASATGEALVSCETFDHPEHWTLLKFDPAGRAVAGFAPQVDHVRSGSNFAYPRLARQGAAVVLRGVGGTKFDARGSKDIAIRALP